MPTTDPGVVGVLVGAATIRRAEQILGKPFSPEEGVALCTASSAIWSVLCGPCEDPLLAIDEYLRLEGAVS